MNLRAEYEVCQLCARDSQGCKSCGSQFWQNSTFGVWLCMEGKISMSFLISPICVSISEPIECSSTTAPARKLYISPTSRRMLNRMCIHKSVFTAPHLPHDSVVSLMGNRWRPVCSISSRHHLTRAWRPPRRSTLSYRLSKGGQNLISLVITIVEPCDWAQTKANDLYSKAKCKNRVFFTMVRNPPIFDINMPFIG